MNQSLYRQIETRLRQRICWGGYRIGDHLPSIRDLIRDYESSFQVVHQALNLLAADGIVELRHGAGTFITRIPELPQSDGKRILLAIVAESRKNSFIAQVIDGFTQAAAASGADVVVRSVTQDPTSLNSVIQECQPAVVALHSQFSFPHIRVLEDQGIPHILLGIGHLPTVPERVSLIDHDSRDAYLLATQHLLAHGHRQIACLTWKNDTWYIQSRINGWKDAHLGAGLNPDPELVVQVEEEGALSMLGVWHGAFNRLRPTAVLLAQGEQYEYLVRWAEDMGFSIPTDLSIITTTVRGTPGPSGPPPTCITIDGREFGMHGLSLALEQQLKLPPRRITLPAWIRLGATTGSPGVMHRVDHR